LAGRAHAYEGHAARDLAAPIRILRGLGVERLILTNAAGGLSLQMAPGALMLVTDHINFSGQNPLIGPNDEGPRFFDMSRAYDAGLQAKFEQAAQASDITLKSGVYLYVTGPNFETPAEVRMFAKLGADAVGLSLITNLGAGLSPERLSQDEIMREGAGAYDKVERLLLSFFSLTPENIE
jgi:inosine/guanosine/xanthosine phosphorylase family protein